MTFAGVPGVIRNCSSGLIESDKCEDVNDVDVKAKSCYCKTDYCNDGQLVKPTACSVVIGVSIATVTAITWMNLF